MLRPAAEVIAACGAPPHARWPAVSGARWRTCAPRSSRLASVGWRIRTRGGGQRQAGSGSEVSSDDDALMMRRARHLLATAPQCQRQAGSGSRASAGAAVGCASAGCWPQAWGCGGGGQRW
jgi:hypothetical protein